MIRILVLLIWKGVEAILKQSRISIVRFLFKEKEMCYVRAIGVSWEVGVGERDGGDRLG